MLLSWSCPAGSEGTAVTASGDVPTCASGQGQWVEAPANWWAYQIPGDQVATLFGAEFLFVAVLIVGAAVGRAIDGH